MDVTHSSSYALGGVPRPFVLAFHARISNTPQMLRASMTLRWEGTDSNAEDLRGTLHTKRVPSSCRALQPCPTPGLPKPPRHATPCHRPARVVLRLPIQTFPAHVPRTPRSRVAVCDHVCKGREGRNGREGTEGSIRADQYHVVLFSACGLSQRHPAPARPRHRAGQRVPLLTSFSRDLRGTENRNRRELEGMQSGSKTRAQLVSCAAAVSQRCPTPACPKSCAHIMRTFPARTPSSRFMCVYLDLCCTQTFPTRTVHGHEYDGNMTVAHITGGVVRVWGSAGHQLGTRIARSSYPFLCVPVCSSSTYLRTENS